MIRYLNYLFFILLFLVFFSFDFNKKISTNMESILPNSQNKELLKEFLELNANKKIYFILDDKKKLSLEEIRKIEESIEKIDSIEKVQFKKNIELEKFKEEYKTYFQEFDENRILNLNIKKALTEYYQELTNSFLVSNFDKNDPLNIVKKQNFDLELKNARVYKKEYGYLLSYTLNKNISSLDQYKKIYKEIKKLEEKYEELKSFSPIFYFVENSQYIKNDASKIALVATSLLLVLYLLILKNIKLLINTLLVLVSSSFFASIVLMTIFKELSIFVLVFGISISTIAIDYMFHHYFHKNYNEKKVFNKEVFLGFFTTITVFFILSFSGFTLLTQISYFSILSLLYSYLIFSFVFPKIGFEFKEVKSLKLKLPSIDYRYFLVFSIVVFTYSINSLNFNFDIKALDYDNKTLKKQEDFFRKALLIEEKTVVLIKANTIEKLLEQNEEIKRVDTSSNSPLDNLISHKKFKEKLAFLESIKLKDIQKELNIEANILGFKKGYFEDCYNYKTTPTIYTYNTLLKMGIDIKRVDNSFISYIFISKDKRDEILKKEYVHSLSIKDMFEQQLKTDMKKTTYLGLVSLFLILFVFLIFAKKQFIYTLSFLLFPLCVIMLYLSMIQINILHLFMSFIIVGISIDYAIYFTKNQSESTKKAIFFSALSSFAGFAVLVFSDIPSLFSMGIVATLGIGAIVTLILFQKGKK
ncbi:hypothetical protein [Halarcobacter ebronensis]|uniref:Membrane transport protein MMPL domain-containing protein n=1 Tax=Halarcobacter ebronensis TaxID=1462615 RepID=A0A4Q1ARP3_9BACT|nr:hypothetical protein [Halarcobacter ebronensis]QKF83510.1 putative membrane protein [Halarcobacter ebronensis]RXK08304.1 hypothetical protein CRV07_00420 [Halarcobacter ebronensis]